MNLEKINELHVPTNYQMNWNDIDQLLSLIDQEGMNGAIKAINLSFKYGYTQSKNESRNASRKVMKDITNKVK